MDHRDDHLYDVSIDTLGLSPQTIQLLESVGIKTAFFFFKLEGANMSGSVTSEWVSPNACTANQPGAN